MKIRTIVLGGEIIEPPAMIWSAETTEAVLKYRADKLFFSSSSATEKRRSVFPRKRGDAADGSHDEAIEKNVFSRGRR